MYAAPQLGVQGQPTTDVNMSDSVMFRGPALVNESVNNITFYDQIVDRSVVRSRAANVRQKPELSLCFGLVPGI
jgi:hypothetical protein